jgi:hypothetical protein
MSDVLMGKAFRNQHLYGLADQFFSAKPEHLLRLPINLLMKPLSPMTTIPSGVNSNS